MRFPELYIERLRVNEEAFEVLQGLEASGDVRHQDFKECQKVLRESSSIIETILPNDWGLEDGTLIYLTGDTVQRMYRINRNKIEFHDRKDYWFPERKLSAYDLVTKIRRGTAMILQEIEPSFDNREDGL